MPLEIEQKEGDDGNRWLGCLFIPSITIDRMFLLWLINKCMYVCTHVYLGRCSTWE